MSPGNKIETERNTIKKDGHLIDGRLPVLDRHGTFSGDVSNREIQELERSLVTGERTPVYGTMEYTTQEKDRDSGKTGRIQN